YLDLIEALGLKSFVLAGISFGGWLAAEIAVMACPQITHVVLANPAGIKTGGRTERDMIDIFSLSQTALDEMSFHDPRFVTHVHPSSSEDEVLVELPNREATGRFAWSPYMHNPKLKGRLHRIRQPSLVLWGASDRLAPAEYGRSFSTLLGRGSFEQIDGAGR